LEEIAENTIMSNSGNLSVQLSELCAELKRVDQRLESETVVDLGVLNEFRRSLDTARLTAWTVSELLNAQLARKEPSNLLAFYSAERLRRLDELIQNLCEDINRQVVTFQTQGLEPLSDSVQLLQERLAQLVSEQHQKEPQAEDASQSQKGLTQAKTPSR
jgi:hypothetical protein